MALLGETSVLKFEKKTPLCRLCKPLLCPRGVGGMDGGEPGSQRPRCAPHRPPPGTEGTGNVTAAARSGRGPRSRSEPEVRNGAAPPAGANRDSLTAAVAAEPAPLGAPGTAAPGSGSNGRRRALSSPPGCCQRGAARIASGKSGRAAAAEHESESGRVRRPAVTPPSFASGSGGAERFPTGRGAPPAPVRPLCGVRGAFSKAWLRRGSAQSGTARRPRPPSAAPGGVGAPIAPREAELRLLSGSAAPAPPRPARAVGAGLGGARGRRSAGGSCGRAALSRFSNAQTKEQ